MKHIEGTFTGCQDKELYYQGWLPDGDSNTTILMVHGLAEHSGRYMNLVNHFVPAGYALYGFDLQGHGKSEGARCFVEKFSDYVDDLNRYFDIIKEKHPDNRIFLYGHSMGATIAADFTTKYQGNLAGLLVSGIVLKVTSNASPLLVKLAPLMSKLVPKLGVTAIDCSTLSRDSAVVEAALKDPLYYNKKVSVRLGSELLRETLELPERLRGVNLPVLIMHGTADQLVAPESSQILYRGVSSEDKTLKLYEDYYHEIHNEPGREQVFSDMGKWLEAHL